MQKKLLGTLQAFQNKMQQISLKNFNFKIVKKIEVTENKHKKLSQNFNWDIF